MGIAGQGVADEDGVRFVRVEPAVGLVGKRDGTQRLAALELQLVGRLCKGVILRLDASDAAVCLLTKCFASDTLIRFQILYALILSL